MKRLALLLLLAAALLPAQAQNDAAELIAKGENAETLHLLDLAQSYYQQAQASDPAAPLPYLRLGLLAERRCHFNQAVYQLRQAATLVSSDSLAVSDSATRALAATIYEHLTYCIIENEDMTDLDQLKA